MRPKLSFRFANRWSYIIVSFFFYFRKHKELSASRQSRDEKDVESIMDTITNMINPFDNEFEKLVHIVSGVEASNEIQEASKTMLETGESSFNAYVLGNLLSESPDVDKKMTKTKLKTFKDLSKNTKTTSSKNEIISIKSTKDLFAKMVLLAKSRDVDMKEVLQYSLRPYPSPIATFDGSMVKTQKSKLMQIVEEKANIDHLDSIPRDGCIVIDAMALLQTMKTVPNTFGELSKIILNSIVQIASKFETRRIDFVCDRYPEHSIKGTEREKRGIAGSTIVKIFGKAQKVPRQWKKFLSSGQNKEEIMEFLFNDWKQLPASLFKDFEIYLCHKDKCHLFYAEDLDSSLSYEMIDELKCDHEEADTRMALHVHHAASSGFENIVIRSPDTDVFIIMLHVCSLVSSNLFFLTGTGMKRRVIPLTSTFENIGAELCDALVGFHSFTGKSFCNEFIFCFIIIHRF